MGIRLGDITRAVPKPLLEGGEGVAFQGVVIEQVARQGFTDVILLARRTAISAAQWRYISRH
jgi:NDP-sugar pyrophosphorylase family protein